MILSNVLIAVLPPPAALCSVLKRVIVERSGKGSAIDPVTFLFNIPKLPDRAVVKEVGTNQSYGGKLPSVKPSTVNPGLIGNPILASIVFFSVLDPKNSLSPSGL